MDPDPDSNPDPAIFIVDLQDAKKTSLKKVFLLITYLLFEGTVHLHHFSDKKVQKKPQNSMNQGFSYNFCLAIEGSGSGSIPCLTNGSPDPGGPKKCGSGGTLSLSNGSGTGRPKNMWIRSTALSLSSMGIKVFLTNFA